jgi:hypothetical protein
MTKQELSQCYWLNREIEQLQRELQELDGKEYKLIDLSGMPRGGMTSDSVARLATQKAELHRLISLKIEECMIARTRIERYINTVEDSEMRMILRLRHINGMTWDGVAREMNYSGRQTQRLYSDFMKQKMS